MLVEIISGNLKFAPNTTLLLPKFGLGTVVTILYILADRPVSGIKYDHLRLRDLQYRNK